MSTGSAPAQLYFGFARNIHDALSLYPSLDLARFVLSGAPPRLLCLEMTIEESARAHISLNSPCKFLFWLRGSRSLWMSNLNPGNPLLAINRKEPSETINCRNAVNKQEEWFPITQSTWARVELTFSGVSLQRLQHPTRSKARFHLTFPYESYMECAFRLRPNILNSRPAIHSKFARMRCLAFFARCALSTRTL